MIGFDFETELFERGLEKFESRFRGAMVGAVRHAGAAVLERIIEYTADPAAPPALYYKRTGRLMGGWTAASDALDVPLIETYESDSEDDEGGPQETGSFRLANDVTTNTISAIMENDVPYAWWVEMTGTWVTEWPDRRWPYLMATRSIIESRDKFNRFLVRAWGSL